MRAPDWVLVLARDWGKEMRRIQKNADGVRGPMGKIAKQGPEGAAIRGESDHLPDIDFEDEEVARFHRAWLDLDGYLNRIVALDFVQRMRAPEKWAEMGMEKNKYYETRTTALTSIAIDFHLYE